MNRARRSRLGEIRRYQVALRVRKWLRTLIPTPHKLTPHSRSQFRGHPYRGAVPGAYCPCPSDAKSASYAHRVQGIYRPRSASVVYTAHSIPLEHQEPVRASHWKQFLSAASGHGRDDLHQPKTEVQSKNAMFDRLMAGGGQ